MAKPFKVLTVPYTAPSGDRCVLRTDYVKGHKSYWLEDEDGNKKFRPRFYNADVVETLLEDINADPVNVHD